MAVTLKGQTAVYEGTSTDTKPTDADNNAIFKELDTGIRYYYDGTDWNEIPSSGGGGGGTGTDNYNDLNNKPSINGTTLSGNKSLDNLGIQAKLTFDNAPTEDSKNPVESGGVYSALAGKQDAISDLSTIRSGAAAGATAVQPATLETALAGKQDALSSEQLDAVNSGVTSADVEQITTNKNNILFNQNMGVKNILKNTATSSGIFTVNADGTIKAQGSSGGSTAFVIVSTISASDAYKLNGMILNGCPSGGESGGYRINLQLYGGDYTNYAIDKGDGAVISGIPQTPSYNLRVIVAVEAGKTVDILYKPMISTTGGDYQPYAPSNRELYEMILAMQ